MALGALGAELVGACRVRREAASGADNVEALVQGEIGPLVYLEVIGEAEQPRIRRVDIGIRRVSETSRRAAAVRGRIDQVAIVGTFRGAVHLDIQLILAA